MSNELGSKIQERRRSLVMTVEELAERAYLSVGSIRAYEQGRRTPSLEALLRIGLVLDESFDEYKEGLAPYPGALPPKLSQKKSLRKKTAPKSRKRCCHI